MNWTSALALTLLTLTSMHVIAADTAYEIRGCVRRVIDGDTFILSQVAREPIRVRIWGINAPERNAPGGPQAAFVLRALFETEGARLHCSYRDTDRHRRLVAQCKTTRGTDLGVHLVSRGAARDCPRFSKGHYARYETSSSATLPEADFCRPR